MKYTVEGFGQERMVALGMDAVDAVFLRWFVDWSASGTMLMELFSWPPPGDRTPRPFYWLRYDHCIAELPILGIHDKDALARRLRRLSKSLVLCHATLRREGTFSYYGVGPRYGLLVGPSVPKAGEVPSQMPDPSVLNAGTKTLLPEDTSIRNEDPSPSGDTPEEVLKEVSKSVAKRLKAQLKKRGEAWQHAADLTVARGGPWAAGAKEAVSMDKLVAWAMLKAPGKGEKFLVDFLEGAWALKRGDVMGLSTKDLGFWASQPYTPSRLLCHAMAICAVLEHLEESNRPLTPQQMKMMGAP